MRPIDALRITAPAAAGFVLLLVPLTSGAEAPALQDSQHDFDFNIGSWKTEIQRLAQPLSGSHTWLHYSGTHVVRKVWGGKADLGELEVDGAGAHIEDAMLRLYDPTAHQWNLYIGSSKSGALGTPLTGEFKDGIGVFVGVDTYEGRTVLVRDVWSKITATTCHNEWSYSVDGGKTWEVNWIADDTRTD